MDEAPGRSPEVLHLISGVVVLFVARVTAAALALVQTILLATKFGASASTDAWFLASALCFLFIAPIETALNVAFVPAFVHRAETEGEAAAWRIAAGLFRIGLLGAGGVALLLAVVAPWLSPLLAPGFDDVTNLQMARFIQVMAPVVLFGYAAAFLSSLDFIEGRYALPAAGMIVSAITGPVALLLFADRYGVVSLAWGALVGAIVRCLLVIRVPQTRRLLGPGMKLRDPALRELGFTIASRLLTSGFIELNMMVDRVFASLLGPGFISALAYASRAVTTVVRVFLIPMARMLLPSLTRLAARQRYDRIRGLLEKLVIGLAFVMLPLVAFMVAFRTELLGILFQRGAFDAAAVDTTAEALLYYTLGIIPFLMTPLLSGAFFALQDSATPLRIGMVCVVANVGLDAVLMLGLGHGGIALATSLVAALRAFLLWVYLKRRVGALRTRFVLGSLLVSSGTAALAFWGAQVLVTWSDPAWLVPLSRLFACGVIGGAGYLLLQALFNRPVVQLIPALLGRLQVGRP
jgi:putative peptidoglycan lipid II flippase